jgi:hypothetical protein
MTAAPAPLHAPRRVAELGEGSGEGVEYPVLRGRLRRGGFGECETFKERDQRLLPFAEII